MALIYGIVSTFAMLLRKWAALTHARLQQKYARLEEAFQRLEADCKCEEVAVGRPAGYADQLRLLKSFELKERARRKWVQAAERLNARQQTEAAVRRFSQHKLPYTFGLIDMALVMKLIDEFGSFGLSALFEQHWTEIFW